MSLLNKLQTDYAFYDAEIAKLEQEKQRLIALRDQIAEVLGAAVRDKAEANRPQGNSRSADADRFPQVNDRYAAILAVLHDHDEKLRKEGGRILTYDEVAFLVKQRRPSSNATPRSIASDVHHLRKNHNALLPSWVQARGRG